MFTLFMFSSFGMFIALFSCVWLFLAGLEIVRQVKRGGRVNWLVSIAGLFLMVGAGGFFAAGLSAMGVITLPDSFEWPSGYVRGVVQTQDGKYVVPHIPAGRVQLYDSQWRFIRGWHADASGGDFSVACLPTGEIVVFTARPDGKSRSGSSCGSNQRDGSCSCPGSMSVTHGASPNPRSLYVAGGHHHGE